MSIIVLVGATVTTGIYDNNSIPQCCPRIDCARREGPGSLHGLLAHTAMTRSGNRSVHVNLFCGACPSCRVNSAKDGGQGVQSKLTRPTEGSRARHGTVGLR
jgi:hypothetical protein